MSDVGNMAKPERAEKHVQIAEALDCLDSAIHRLNELVMRVRGESTDKTGMDAAVSQSSLVEVLDGSNQVIREKAERIDKIRNELESMLF